MWQHQHSRFKAYLSSRHQNDPLQVASIQAKKSTAVIKNTGKGRKRNNDGDDKIKRQKQLTTVLSRLNNLNIFSKGQLEKSG